MFPFGIKGSNGSVEVENDGKVCLSSKVCDVKGDNVGEVREYYVFVEESRILMCENCGSRDVVSASTELIVIAIDIVKVRG